MIVCRGCGHGNADVVPFCESCGAFLEWEGERVEQRPAHGRATTTAVASPPRPRPVVDALTPMEPPIDVADPPPTADVPDARLPEAEQPRTPPVRPQAYDVGPADQYCGACGAGNARERRYCRTCGVSLTDVERAERLSWWARLVAWVKGLFRREKRLSAGERPEDWAKTSSARRSRRWWRPRFPTRLSLKGLRWPLLILGLVGIGIAPVRMQVMEWGMEAYSSVRRVIAPQFVPVAGASATASSETEAAATASIDQNKLTWWAEGVPGDGAGESITVAFDGPVDLAKVGFINGAPEAEFPLQPRLHDVEVTYNDEVGQVATQRLSLADERELQTFDLSGTAVTSVTVRILSTYAGQQGDATSVSELAFFTKK